MHNRVLSILLGLVLILMAACNSTPTTSNQTTASFETINQQSASATRVVALSSLSADIIAQLDATKLVGIPGSRLLQNDERFKNMTRVSEGRVPPNLEKIVALKPDLVVGAAGFAEQTTQKLKDLGIPVFLTKVDSWKSLNETTKTLAQLINADPQPLLNRYQTFLADKPNQNLSALVLVSRQPILTPNQSSWAGDLLNQFQVKNIAAQLQGKSPFGGYITLSPEKILQTDPDVLLVVDTEPGVVDFFKSQSFWKKLKATQNNRVYTFDYYGLVNPGSVEAIEKTCNQLRQVLSGTV
ncbi:ABC transporter substrate-binding protein [Chroococcidiopsis sp. TS-821]|uniref:ABC transporter substrate-binding protein n=1 Tax=Chroococcidiopsis sp. TS-821 TaxID=1378066 RepID=UPI000CEDD182|nr:ABC transporter substrate-binding protein [Chroococcidiopsis sp. TS-821]PPS43172.1 iron ABC transporter substrate-binding protein [Chroococcidiopsis sp. TS-821]